MERKFTYIVIENEDGSVAQMDVLLEAGPTAFDADGAANALFMFDEERNVWERPDEDYIIEDELIRSGFEGRPWRRITPEQHAEFHGDRIFRDAKKMDLSVDMDKAKEIHKNRLRRERIPLLNALDIDMIRATEIQDKDRIKSIIAKKQKLRDITKQPEIAAATTPEELLKVTIGD